MVSLLSAHHRDQYGTTYYTKYRHPFPWRDSNPQSQQAIGRRPTLESAVAIRMLFFLVDRCFEGKWVKLCNHGT
jgi:hypothetical protein